MAKPGTAAWNDRGFRLMDLEASFYSRLGAREWLSFLRQHQVRITGEDATSGWGAQVIGFQDDIQPGQLFVTALVHPVAEPDPGAEKGGVHWMLALRRVPNEEMPPEDVKRLSASLGGYAAVRTLFEEKWPGERTIVADARLTVLLDLTRWKPPLPLPLGAALALRPTGARKRAITLAPTTRLVRARVTPPSGGVSEVLQQVFRSDAENAALLTATGHVRAAATNGIIDALEGVLWRGLERLLTERKPKRRSTTRS